MRTDYLHILNYFICYIRHIITFVMKTLIKNS